MKKEIWIVVILAIIIIALIAVLAFVKKPLPTGPGLAPWADARTLSVISPTADQEVSSPLKITGIVGGSGWSGFEGQVGTVKLLDYKGAVLAQTYLAATTEWTALPTKFEATLNFTAANSGPATLEFRNENPSGDPARDRTITMPIKIKATAETMTVKAFFGKNEITVPLAVLFSLLTGLCLKQRLLPEPP